MNLHSLVRPLIAAVNPFIPATVRVSTGQGPTAANGTRPPAYATPGSITASIAGTVLTVTAITAGVLQKGQTLADLTAALAAGTTITGQLTGAEGGIGTYSLNHTYAAPVTSEAMTTSLIVNAQVQPVTWRDLQQLEGLNLNGTRVKIYLYGEIDAIVRSTNKGGDLITIATGVNRGVYLVAQTIEQFPDWCSCACTLQNSS